ncbi:DUF2207 domain-containing protein [Lactobacillus sp. LC28-10]|uniref:DUF2207 domain-containing protein n=1 Tax=Secundilactobacillus angelensis TaxID=2722706 RepID=A0ABX1L0X2_9LACO|nr:DUF2207 domain-containing protein [Secundilactobacillus angelensis]MCH5463066.1 DUF2207 domain-containing protein [Secundilactobacillus angelensis]NLR18873.1 DUF2207 domain-containing protein [Secundilactobacillus angelensis]
MKKRLLFLCTVIFTVLFWGWGNSTASAAGYSIDRYHINVDIQKNGDADVTQRIKYHFDDLFHGVFLKQDYAGTGGIAGKPTVSILTHGHETAVKPENSGESDTYETSDSGKIYQIKVYHLASDETVTYVYKYRIRNVAVNYADTAELNWKIIGRGWTVPLNHVQIAVQLPEKNVKQLQAWTHGPLSGHTQVNRAAGKVTMTVAKVPAKTFVESHMVFPTTVISTNTRTSDKKRLATVQKQEAKLAKQANLKRLQALLIPLGVMVVLLGIGIFYLLSRLRWFKKHVGSPVKETPKVHNFEIPSYSAVTSQSILTESQPDAKAFTAWLMELAADGELTIKPDKDRFSTTYRITETPKMKVEHQNNPLLAFLFNTVGKGNKPDRTFTLSEIHDYNLNHPNSLTLNQKFTAWRKTSYEETDALGLFNHQTDDVGTKGWLLIVFSVILGGFSSVAAIFLTLPVLRVAGVIVSVGYIVTSIAVAIKYMRHLSHYTQAGEDAAGQIRNFRSMLHDIGEFDRSQVGDLILWERMLPYAVAFGLAKRVLKAMAANFSAAELTPFFQSYYPMYLDDQYSGADFSTAFTSTFTAASADTSTSDSSDFSSGSGGSGGFSGGNSGGFGGGSGGGAF